MENIGFYLCRFLNHLLQIAIMVYFYTSLLTLKKRRLINSNWRFFLVLLFISTMLLPLKIVPVLHFLLFLTILVILVIYAFEDTLKWKLLLLFSEASSELLVEYLVSLLTGIVFHRSYADAITDISSISILISFANMVNLTLFMCITVLWKVFIHKIQRKELLLYVLLPMYQLILLIIFIHNYSTYTLFTAIMGNVILIFSMIIDWIMVYSIDSMIKSAQLKETLSSLYAVREYELNYCQAVQKNVDEVHMLKHDLVNYLQTANMLLDNDASQENVREILDAAKKRCDMLRL